MIPDANNLWIYLRYLSIYQVRRDVREHRLLVFREMPTSLSGKRQVEFSSRLGQVESTFYKHPRSPHPDVFRVSNDEGEGCTTWAAPAGTSTARS